MSAQPFEIDTALRLVAAAVKAWRVPYLSRRHVRQDPFRTLVSCIMSLRTKDETTDVAAERLFAKAGTPAAMRALGPERIARLIFPVGFYNQKSKQIAVLSDRLLREFGGKVPSDLETLLTFNGVGRKTANLVVTEAFGLPGICVDTHVHRITNRWGYVRTRAPNETEQALRAKLPQRHWLSINRLLVTYGKRRCTPLSPKCSECALRPMCPQCGVGRTR